MRISVRTRGELAERGVARAWMRAPRRESVWRGQSGIGLRGLGARSHERRTCAEERILRRSHLHTCTFAEELVLGHAPRGIAPDPADLVGRPGFEGRAEGPGAKGRRGFYLRRAVKPRARPGARPARRPRRAAVCEGLRARGRAGARGVLAAAWRARPARLRPRGKLGRTPLPAPRSGRARPAGINFAAGSLQRCPAPAPQRA